MHRFFFAIIIESALSPIQKRKKEKELVAHSWQIQIHTPAAHAQTGRPSTKIAFLARTQPSSLDCWQVEVFDSRARCRCARTYPGLARQTGKRFSGDFIGRSH
jgi:hypothetical protein